MEAPERVELTEDEWRRRLTADQFAVTRRGGTEPPFSGDHLDRKDDGSYTCACCGTRLFDSSDKFDSGTGWPSFTRALEEGRVLLRPDHGHGMVRTEVVCARCDAHLGHVFDDGPAPTGQRYCINSLALAFEER